MNVYEQYRAKLKTPEQAVRVVKSGDWVDYTSNVCYPPLLDAALAERRDELEDVKIRGNLLFGPIQVVECDPERTHFIYNSWHCSGYERKLCDKGLCNYIPMIFRNVVPYYRHFLTVNVAMMCVPPMDKHGYFNLSCAAGIARGILEKADVVILEVNERLPYIYGGFDESIHISEVDCVVEGEHPPLPQFPIAKPTEEDVKIADLIVPYIVDGATLQLGIGGMPNVVGARLAESDLKDLGMHTELCGDAYYELAQAGKLTNRRKSFQRLKGVTGIVFGSQRLYDWVDRNPGVVVEPLEYVNAPESIAQLDDMISINNCIAVDLYGQVCAESAGTRHISGTGGQLDYLTGAAMARGGKAFICMTSSFVDKTGVRRSRVLPYFNGDIVTDPRSQAYYIVTEYGVVNLVGCTTWERAELLISIAHPDFREGLIRAAEEQKIWRRSNKR
ncbi:acetyl-CoA hydrolase/transferase family protein [uncultured Oscillibacter sp.]|uniref:acetyl-CoA hydrolase/transferase family protein n=1 Tax=uncultured Oscillibacter sp. TaxID=876091 RepID=UPI0025DEF20B|nr:acetyl-CoA hydrolase/transferase C-terminal domain-containing protein [uncultured Oscillibacter sp.]